MSISVVTAWKHQARRQGFFLKPLLLTSMLALTACGGSSNNNDDNAGTPPVSEPFALRIIHINDHHSHLDANESTLLLAGEETDVDMGGFARVATHIETLRNKDTTPAITLHAGDAITGTLYFTAYEGEADAAVMNQVCFDAFALGNHEFDRSDAGLVTFLDFLNQGSCQTPALAANVVPALGTPLRQTDDAAYLKPYTLLERGGEQIAVIGLDIAAKTRNSSSPLATTEFLDEAETAQHYIDQLKADGINKIVLLTHYQYANDVALAGNLEGVDVIVGGDSHTLLGMPFADLGLAPGGEYPTVTQDKNGNKVCIVQAWEYANVVGELNVTFDQDGNVLSCEGVPHLLLGDNFSRDGQLLVGGELAAVQQAVAARSDVVIVDEHIAVKALVDEYAVGLDDIKNTVLGTTSDDLCLARIPGDGRGAPLCAPADTADHGSHISTLVAQAFLYLSKEADISIQNGGGVRINVPQGNITLGTAYTLLPFANTLTNLFMTGEEIHRVLEEAVDSAHSGSDGSYPYAAGLRFKVDMNRDAGERVYDLEYRGRDTAAPWAAFDMNENYVVVSNSFTAEGKDGYLTFGTVSARGDAVNTYLDYAQSFADYVKEVGTLSRPLPEEYSTQQYTPRVLR